MKLFLAAAVMVLFAMSHTAVLAKSKSITGNWKGGGSFTTSSGTRERTRCNATIRAKKSKRFRIFAKCAVASLGIIEQSGTFKRIGKNRYAGRFTNEEYDIHGSIYITLKGKKQYISLRSSSGRGSLVLRRR